MLAICTQKQRFSLFTQRVLQHGSLQLRPMQQTDRALFVGLYSNPAVTGLTGVCCDAATASVWFTYALAPRADTRVFYWVIQCVGTQAPIGLIAWQQRMSGSAELGLLLDPAYWRQGYGRRALSLLCDQGFAHGLLDECWLCHAPAHQAMAGLAQACGFVRRQEGDLPAELQHWCLRQPEWAALAAPVPE